MSHLKTYLILWKEINTKFSIWKNMRNFHMRISFFQTMESNVHIFFKTYMSICGMFYKFTLNKNQNYIHVFFSFAFLQAKTLGSSLHYTIVAHRKLYIANGRRSSRKYGRGWYGWGFCMLRGKRRRSGWRSSIYKQRSTMVIVLGIFVTYLLWS